MSNKAILYGNVCKADINQTNTFLENKPLFSVKLTV